MGLMRPIAAILLTVLALSSCKQLGFNKTSEESFVPTVQVNTLAAAFPEGLSISGLPEKNVADRPASHGVLAVDEAALRLQSYKAPFRLSTDPLTNVDRDACEDYRDTLPEGDGDGTQGGCSCSAFTDATVANTDAPDYLFSSGSASAAASKRRLMAKDGVSCFSTELANTFKVLMHTAHNGKLGMPYCFDFAWGMEYGYEVSLREEQFANKSVCMIAFTRAHLASAQAYIDFANLMGEAMFCEALRAEETPMLASYEKVDLKSIVKSGAPKGLTISKAEVARLGDGGDYKVFRSDIEGTMEDPYTETAIDFKIHYVHSPQDRLNMKYAGKLWIEHNLPSTTEGEAERSKAVSVKYLGERESFDDPLRIKMEYRMGDFKDGVDPFSLSGIIDFNQSAQPDGDFDGTTNEFLTKMKMLTYDGYPTEGVMNFALWNNDNEDYKENAQGVLFNVTRDADDTIRGCGFAGAGMAVAPGDETSLSIRRSLKEGLTLDLEGYAKPQLCDYSGAENYGDKIWRQCFKRNDEGNYEIDTEQHTDDYEFIDRSDAAYAAPPAPSSFINNLFFEAHQPLD